MLRRRVQVASAAELPRQTGNMYTASLWAGLASLISELGDELLACQVTGCCCKDMHRRQQPCSKCQSQTTLI